MNRSDPRLPLPEIVQVDKEIAALEDKLAELKLQRVRILSENALINCIPAEVLGRIFELGTHENIHLVPTLTLVSRHWRTTAIHTPTLWSYIKLDHDWNYGRGAELLRKINIYMARAGDAKISVDLDFRYCESVGEARTLMAALYPHLSRCFSFRASVPDWDWMTAVAEGANNMHPSLEEFSLRIDPGDAEDTAPVPFLEGTFPRLHAIMLEQTPLACAFARGQAPQLQQFDLIRDHRYHTNQRMRLALRDYLNALSASPTLETAKLQNSIFGLDGNESFIFHATPERTPIASLTHLSLWGIDAPNIALLLDSVELPSLFSLSVHMDHGHLPPGDPGIAGDLGWLSRLADAAIGGRAPALRQLELRHCTTDGAALGPLIRALHALPALRALGVCAPPSGCAGARLFELLAAGPARTGTWLLPSLRALRLAGCRDVTGHEVLRVVQARSDAAAEGEGVSRLTYVRLAPCYPLDPEVIEALRGSVDELCMDGQ